MSDFENETARKIREQLANNDTALENKEEVKESIEEKIEEDPFAIDQSQYELEPFEEPKIEQNEVQENQKEVSSEEKQEDTKKDNNASDSAVADVKKEIKKGVFGSLFDITEPKTDHFKRKENLRPLALIVGILSLIVCAAVIAVSVFALVKFAPPLFNILVSLGKTFFNEKVLLFTLGFGWLLGGVLVIAIGIFFIALLSLFVYFPIIVIGIPMVSFQTMEQPKQVFAYNKDAKGNMILSYILGFLVAFIGFALYMDGSFKQYIYIPTMAVGLILIAIAILLTIDIVQCKKYFNNLDNETEKAEIKQEARDIETAKKQKKKRRKFLGNVLGKIFRKK